MLGLQRWPEPGVHPKIALDDIPVGAPILGMAPMGVRWMGRRTPSGVIPDRGCPPGEFSPCFTAINDEIKEIE